MISMISHERILHAVLIFIMEKKQITNHLIKERRIVFVNQSIRW